MEYFLFKLPSDFGFFQEKASILKESVQTSTATVAIFIQLPTNNDLRWNDYYERESKIKTTKYFLQSQNSYYKDK